MISATDAAGLRSAIVNANSELSNMTGMSNIYETQASQAKTLIDGQGEYKQAKATAEKNTSKAKEAFSLSKKQFEGTKASRNTTLGQINQLDSKYGEAVSKYTQAHDAKVSADSKYEQSKGVTSQCQANYNNAKATYESTPDTITDANGNQVENPAKKQAETVMKQAEERLTQAKKAEEEAKVNAEKAKDAEDVALRNKEALYDQLGDKKAEADRLEAQLNKQQELVDKKKWITSEELCEFYALGASLPGIIAANTAIFTGRKLLGTKAQSQQQSEWFYLHFWQSYYLHQFCLSLSQNHPSSIFSGA